MVSGRKLIYFGRNFDGPLLRLDTDSSSVNFCIYPPDLGLHESTVGVALGSHIAERKRVRAHGGRTGPAMRAAIIKIIGSLRAANFTSGNLRAAIDGS